MGNAHHRPSLPIQGCAIAASHHHLSTRAASKPSRFPMEASVVHAHRRPSLAGKDYIIVATHRRIQKGLLQTLGPTALDAQGADHSWQTIQIHNVMGNPTPP